MKIVPVLIAAGVVLPGFFQSAAAGHPHRGGYGYAPPRAHHYSYHHSSYYRPSYSHYRPSYRPYCSPYAYGYRSYRPSSGWSLSFGSPVRPGYYGRSCGPGYSRYGSYRPGFSFSIGSGYGYWGY